MKITDEQAAKILRELISSVREVSSNEEEFKAAIAVIGFEQGMKCRLENTGLRHQLKEALKQRDAARAASFRAETWLRMLHKVSGNVMTKHDAAELLADIRQCEDLRAWEFEGGNVPRYKPQPD